MLYHQNIVYSAVNKGFRLEKTFFSGSDYQIRPDASTKLLHKNAVPSVILFQFIYKNRCLLSDVFYNGILQVWKLNV